MNFEIAYQENFDWLVRSLCSRTDRENAEELAQQTFICLYEKWHTVDPRQPFRNLLSIVAKNKFLDHLRRESRNERIRGASRSWIRGATIEDAVGGERNPGESLVWRESVDRLPAKERAIVDLKLKGHTTGEAAKQLGISQASAYRRLEAARASFVS